jgi:hypothetical protein
LRLGRIALPNDEELWKDLTAPSYKTDNGKIAVQSKKDIFKNIRRSPDKGDAACYGNFVRRRRPLRTVGAGAILENTEQRDYGLERIFAAQAKRDAVQQRHMQKLLRTMSKKRA